MYAISTDCDKEWAIDFPDKPFIPYSEYGEDEDGLPLWFKRYWFAQKRDFAALTGVTPPVIPAKTSVETLRKHYEEQSDPTAPDNPYEVGHAWDMRFVVDRKLFSHVNFDDRSRPVWHYLFKVGEAGNIPADGDYHYTHLNDQRVNWIKEDLAHLSTWWYPPYRQTMGIIRQQVVEGDAIRTWFRPDRNVMMVLGWRSPVAGTVSLRGDVRPDPRNNETNLEVLLNNASLLRKTVSGEGFPLEIEGLDVRPGDMIHIAARADGQHHLGIDNLAVVLDRLEP
jgi:hypothetical protein